MEQNNTTAPAGMQGVQRRAADSPEARYRAFDTYPWTKDRAFTTQLASALAATALAPSSEESSSSSSPTLALAALAARIARFEQQTKITIDADAYQAWLTANNARQPPLVSEQVVMAESMAVTDPAERLLARLLVELGEPLGRIALHTESQPQQLAENPDASPSVPATTADSSAVNADVPSWQAAAPKAELYVPRDAASEATSGGEAGKEPYPKKFMEIIEFIQTGKPIEGIRKIPDTVIEDPSISTTGRMQAPLKPWERRAAAAGSDTSPAVTADSA